MDLFKYDKQYYTTKELIENINYVLSLTSRDTVQSFELTNWKATKLIKQTKTHKWSKEEYLNVLGYVYLRKVLGIYNNNINKTQELLITLAEHPKTAFHKNNLQLLKLYNG